MQHCDSLFHAARILTQDAGRTILEDAALAVRNGRIAAVGENLPDGSRTVRKD